MTGSGLGLRLNAGLPYHVESHEDSPKPGSPVSSVGYHFKEAFSGQLQAHFSFPPGAQGLSAQVFGLWRMRNFQGRGHEEDILGEELRIRALGGGLAVTQTYGKRHRGFASLAFTWNSPRGSADLDTVQLTMEYKSTPGIQASVGWEGRFFGVGGPALGIGLSYDYLVLDRGQVNVYSGSSYLGRLLPAGDNLLPDYCFTPFLSIGFGFDLD